MNHHPQARWHPLMWGVIASLLLLPLVAMQFTREVNWTGFDFAVAAALLIIPGLLFEIAAARVRDPGRRIAIGGALLILVVIIWLQGAVGIF